MDNNNDLINSDSEINTMKNLVSIDNITDTMASS